MFQPSSARFSVRFAALCSSGGTSGLPARLCRLGYHGHRCLWVAPSSCGCLLLTSTTAGSRVRHCYPGWVTKVSFAVYLCQFRQLPLGVPSFQLHVCSTLVFYRNLAAVTKSCGSGRSLSAAARVRVLRRCEQTWTSVVIEKLCFSIYHQITNRI